MFDLGFPELMVVAIVAVLVVGPRELPRVLRTVTSSIKKIRGLASEFQSSMEEMAREADLEDIKKDMKSVQSGDWTRELEDDIDPTGELQKSMKDFEKDMKDAYTDPANQAPANSIKPPADESRSDDDTTDIEDRTPRFNADGREVAEGHEIVPKVKEGGNAAPTYAKADSAETKTTAAKKADTKKASAKKDSAKKSAAKQTAQKTAAAKTAAPKTAAAKTATKKATSKKSAGKKAAAKKTAAKKAAGKPDSGTKS